MWEKGGGRERERESKRRREREKNICMRVFRCCLMHVGVCVCVCVSVNCMDAAVCVGMVYVGIYVVNINV